MSHIRANDPIIREVFGMLPTPLWPHVWVGGSAATHYGQHGDVDVWIGKQGDALSVEEQQLATNLINRPDYRHENPAENYPGSSSVMVWSGFCQGNTLVHIMMCLKPVEDVLAGFDISCHAAMRNMTTGVELKAPGWTRYEVRILNAPNEAKSLMRGIKFAVRYGDDDFFKDLRTREIATKLFFPEDVAVSRGL